VKDLVVAGNCSTKAACNSVGIARSTYYYRSDRSEDGQLGVDLECVAGQFPKYGTRRITHQLRRRPYSYSINRKRVQRIMREKRLVRPVKRARYRTTNSQHPYPRYPNLMQDLEVVRPEQCLISEDLYLQLNSSSGLNCPQAAHLFIFTPQGLLKAY